jgi:hypothetical protein
MHVFWSDWHHSEMVGCDVGMPSLFDSIVGAMWVLFRQILLPAAVSIWGYAGNHSELCAGSCGCPWNGRRGSCVPFGVRISSYSFTRQ